MTGIFQFLQGIAEYVFTAVRMGKHMVHFLTDSIGGFSTSFSEFSAPEEITALFTLIIGLALIDKLRKRG